MTSFVDHLMYGFLFIPLLLIHVIDILSFYVLHWIKGSSIMSFDSMYSSRRKEKKAIPVSEQDLSSKSTTETAPYRNVRHLEKLLETPVADVTTLDGLLDWAGQKYRDQPAIGRRILEKVEEKVITKHKAPASNQDDKSSTSPTSPATSVAAKPKTWQISHFKPGIQWLTYAEFAQRVRAVAQGLQNLIPEKESSSRLMIFENTCMEWMITAHACFRSNIVLSTVYANLGSKALIAAINETETSILFTNVNEVKQIGDRLAQECPKLKHIICNLDGIPEVQRKDYPIPSIQSSSIKILSLKEVEQLGEQKQKQTEEKPQKDGNDLACIMYTSGTTGKPKGVQLTHKQVLSCIAGINDILEDDRSVGKSLKLDFLGYLPLAHILEFVAEHAMLVRGGTIGYGSPRTITSSGARPCGDLDAFQPTVLIGVPKMFETIRKKAIEKLKSTGPLGKGLFDTAFSFKLASVKAGRATPIWDALFFNKFKKLIGGKVQIMLSGGAPLGAESHEFMRVCFGATFIQGYGLTESAGAVSIQGVFDPFETHSVGVPIASCEVKLISQPEMGYLVSDKPCPRGELAVRGNNITQGYYQQEDETKKAFHDGWFLTGDIAEFNWDGVIKIVDRKKNLVKLSGGEYIAVEHLESLYGTSNLVSNIMIYADQSQDAPVALVVPNFKPIQEWAKKNNLPAEDKEKLAKSKRVNDYVKKSLLEAVGGELKSFEKIRDVRLVPGDWTVENDCLTAAQKLKRNTIEKRHKDLLEEMKQQISES